MQHARHLPSLQLCPPIFLKIQVKSCKYEFVCCSVHRYFHHYHHHQHKQQHQRLNKALSLKSFVIYRQSKTILNRYGFRTLIQYRKSNVSLIIKFMLQVKCLKHLAKLLPKLHSQQGIKTFSVVKLIVTMAESYHYSYNDMPSIPNPLMKEVILCLAPHIFYRGVFFFVQPSGSAIHVNMHVFMLIINMFESCNTQGVKNIIHVVILNV